VQTKAPYFFVFSLLWTIFLLGRFLRDKKSSYLSKYNTQIYLSFCTLYLIVLLYDVFHLFNFFYMKSRDVLAIIFNFKFYLNFVIVYLSLFFFFFFIILKNKT
jgi:hypothetical protein